MRIEYWEDKLIEYIESRRYMPFEWGKNDCTSFCAYALEAQSDLNFTSKFITWTTEEEAKEKMSIFGKDLTEAVSNVAPGLGLYYCDNIKLMGRGDITIIEGPKGLTCALCIGSKLAIPGPEGLVFMRLQGYGCWKWGNK